MRRRKCWRAVCDDGDFFSAGTRKEAHELAERHSEFIAGSRRAIGYRLQWAYWDTHAFPVWRDVQNAEARGGEQ